MDKSALAEVSPQSFAEAWIQHVRSGPASNHWDATKWTMGATISWSVSCPEKMYEAIKAVATHELNEAEIEKLGIGPLETLLAHNLERAMVLMSPDLTVNPTIMTALSYVQLDEVGMRRMEEVLGKFLH